MVDSKRLWHDGWKPHLRLSRQFVPSQWLVLGGGARRGLKWRLAYDYAARRNVAEGRV